MGVVRKKEGKVIAGERTTWATFRVKQTESFIASGKGKFVEIAHTHRCDI